MLLHVLLHKRKPKVCNFSTFIHALGVKLNDYRDVMSDSQTSTVAER